MTKFRCCARVARLLLCYLLLGPLGTAHADEFQARYARGLRCYSQGDYETAIGELQAAFAIRQLPRLLFNLGQAHRKLGHAREALGYLQNYLRVQTNPTPEDRAELESYIAATRPLVEIAESERRKIATDLGPLSPQRQVSTAHPAPAHKKWWFWTVLGGSALTIAAVGLGVGLAPRNPCGHSIPCFSPY